MKRLESVWALLKQCSCASSSSVTNTSHGMQRKFVQTRLPSSFSKSESSTEGKPSLKRKSSETETMATTPSKNPKSYANAAKTSTPSGNRASTSPDYQGHNKSGQENTFLNSTDQHTVRNTSSRKDKGQGEEWPKLDQGSGSARSTTVSDNQGSGSRKSTSGNPAWGSSGSDNQGSGSGRSTTDNQAKGPGSSSATTYGQSSDPGTSSAQSDAIEGDSAEKFHSSPSDQSESSSKVEPHKIPLPPSRSQPYSSKSLVQSSSSQQSEDPSTQHSGDSPKSSGSDTDEDDADMQKLSSEESLGHWKGTPLNKLKRAPKCYDTEKQRLPELRPTRDHKVFFIVPRDGRYDKSVEPYPDKFEDGWDDRHVYMPCSRSNKMPDQSESGGLLPRWEIIRSALQQDIVDVFALESAILSYNSHYKRRWKFDALHTYFAGLPSGKRDQFFVETLPKMQTLALRLPELCTKRIPILKQRENKKLTFSQEQIACLLANAFFCTFPKRNAKFRDNPLPDINFSNLFSDSHRTSRKIEKFKCIFNYFERVTTNMPTGTVSYARQVVDYSSTPDWYNLGKDFCELHVSTNGTIEDDGDGMLQADFANKYVGGGVLGNGLVQEEIRFVLCPEMIVSRLFTAVLQDNEVLIMTGCERFNDYKGYGDTFKFTQNYEDRTKRDAWGRKFTEVVAMDALVVRSRPNAQFEWGQVRRELTKAYCAFMGNEFRKNLPAVRTGNWGCGAFGGDKHLKALIQLMAATAAGRDVVYFTFGDRELCNELAAVHKIFKNEGINIRNACDLIKDYHNKMLKNYSNYDRKQSLFGFIALMLGTTLRSSPNSSDDDSDGNGHQGGSFDYKANTP